MDQFIPEVSDAEVDRVLSRDYPAEVQFEIRGIIQQVNVREKNRVILACMKSAAGDVQKLKLNLNDAAGYYRELILEAEYPFYAKKMFRIDKLPEQERAALIEKDKEQYLRWLNRGSK